MKSEKWHVAGICLLTFVFCSLVSGLTGCAPQKEVSKTLQDKPLASFQTTLLQTAFDIATAMPVNPHIKDRSKAQYKTVTACLELDQPIRALSYADKIGNWRRGMGYADYAFYSIQQGATNNVLHYLELADEISKLATQDWRRDRIKAKIAQTHLLMGQTETAAKFSNNLEPSESGKAEKTEAMLSREDDFSVQTNQLDGLILSENFDLVKNALYALAQLFDRFYGNADQRMTIEEKIKSSWDTLPYAIRIDLWFVLTEISLKHADSSKALGLVEETEALMSSVTWPVEYQIPLKARLTGLRFRAGDTNTAHSSLTDLQIFYQEHQSDIINIYKAETLIPVAEAFQVMRDSFQAVDIYRQAVEASVENPNSRPQAEDLSAICLSMALHGVEPDETLWNRIHEVQSNLGDPW
ncbi:MAG: hypothetical protein AB7E95_04150 [Kiritimatiellales bacterium]